MLDTNTMLILDRRALEFFETALSMPRGELQGIHEKFFTKVIESADHEYDVGVELWCLCTFKIAFSVPRIELRDFLQNNPYTEVMKCFDHEYDVGFDSRAFRFSLSPFQCPEGNHEVFMKTLYTGVIECGDHDYVVGFQL